MYKSRRSCRFSHGKGISKRTTSRFSGTLPHSVLTGRGLGQRAGISKLLTAPRNALRVAKLVWTLLLGMGAKYIAITNMLLCLLAYPEN